MNSRVGVMAKPKIVKCPNCGAVMVKRRRVEEAFE